MYDMYPWNDPDSRANHDQDEPAAWLPAPREAPADPAVPAVPAVPADPAASAVPADPAASAVPADPAASAVRAVQVALDRRDNGGDALAVAGQPATRPAARPTAARTRQ